MQLKFVKKLSGTCRIFVVIHDVSETMCQVNLLQRMTSCTHIAFNRFVWHCKVFGFTIHVNIAKSLSHIMMSGVFKSGQLVYNKPKRKKLYGQWVIQCIVKLDLSGFRNFCWKITKNFHGYQIYINVYKHAVFAYCMQMMKNPSLFIILGSLSFTFAGTARPTFLDLIFVRFLRVIFSFIWHWQE